MFNTINELNINKLKINNNSIFAMGSDFNLTSFDLETGKMFWKAKNMPRDELNLKNPINLLDFYATENGELLVLNGYGSVY